MHVQLKAVLKTKLQVEQSSRIQWVPDAVIIDGCAMLWTVHWPMSDTVEAYVINFMDAIKYHMERTPCRLSDIWRYVENSTKQMTRSSRSGNDASRKHQLCLHTTLPTQKVALNIVHNKVQLINLICHYLIYPNPTPVQQWNNFSLQR